MTGILPETCSKQKARLAGQSPLTRKKEKEQSTNKQTMRIKHLFIGALLFLATGATAQNEMAGMPPAPVDAAVKVGRLDNGLTYYIRKNNYPAGKVNFYIAQKVGAIQERDDQDGLAHLLEHMAFNGSTHFADDSVVKFMDSTGAGWNAYTTADHTVYYFTGVASDRPALVDSCLLVLSDWSEGLTLTEDQIETERDVVHNEYRGHNAMQRLMRAANADLFPNSIYGKRTVIGSMDVIDHCNPETLRAYYRKWYFPGNQAVVVVGDIDPEKIEASIKKLFGGLPVNKEATKATPVLIEDNEEPLFAFGSHQEVTQTYFQIYRKIDYVAPQEKATIAYFMMDPLYEIVNTMFNNRMQKVCQEPNSNLVGVQAMMGNYAGTALTRDAEQIVAVPRPGKDKEAFNEVFREMKRVGEFGFTESEFKHAKEAYMASLEQAYTNRATITNDAHAQKLISNFLGNEPYATIEQRYDMFKQIIPMLQLAEINEMAKELINVNGKNFAMSIIMPEKDGKTTFTKADLPTMFKNASAQKVEAYIDNTKEEPMMTTMPKAGKIVSEKALNQFGAKELTLSNGAKVILKKTNLKANEILMSATAPGGTSITKNESLVMKKLFPEIGMIHGLGTKGLNDLSSIAQTKMTSIDASVSNDIHSLQGATNNENVETLMQMINLSFTDVKKDEGFLQLIAQYLKGKMATKANDPDAVMEDSVAYYTHSKKLEHLSPDASDFDKIDYNRATEIYKQLFSNAGEFTFTFVGSFDEAQIRTLIEKYIASLPASKAKSDLTDTRYYTNGKVQKTFKFKMATPQDKTIDLYRSDKVEYNLANALNARALGQYLGNKMFEIIREKESAVYTPMPSAELESDLTGHYFKIECELATNPEKTDIANKLAKEIIFDAQTKITNEDVARVKEAILKSHQDAVKRNGYWLSVLSDYAIYGVDKANSFDAVMKAMSPKTLGEVAKQVLKTGNHVQVIMKAEKK